MASEIMSDAEEILERIRKGEFGRSVVDVRGTSVQVIRMPDSPGVRGMHQYTWRKIFESIYGSFVLHLPYCAFRLHTSEGGGRTIEVRDIDLLFADRGALETNLIVPGISDDEFRRIQKRWDTVPIGIPEAHELGICRIPIRAESMLEIVF